MKRQIALIVLDGWGYREEVKDNAIAQAHKPIFDGLWSKYPHTILDASGLAVGLPLGQMGNSEVGHMAIGAGRTLDQDLVRIDKAVQDGSFSTNLAFTNLFEHIKKNNGTLHVMGLVSDGGVHSHISHLFAFLKTAKEAGIYKIAVHVFTDGRDVPPQSGALYVKQLEDELSRIGVGAIATVSGRYFAMDRDKNWERLAKAEDAIFHGEGMICDIDPSIYIKNLYTEGKVDEHLLPIVCCDKEGNTHKVGSNDGIFIFNFRADRSRMMTNKILEKSELLNLSLVTMTSYGEEYKSEVAYPPLKIETTLAREISEHNLTQAHIAETEKFAHATYFLNGGVEIPYPGEEQILIPSRKDIATHDLAPRMMAKEITDRVIEKIESGTDFIFVNFANPDMVGHTANVPAVILAIEETDRELGRIIDALTSRGGIAVITADHGNAEINIDPITGERHTAHTTDPVPCIITNTEGQLHSGSLIDVAPTVLQLFNLPIPSSMTGMDLFDK